MSIWRYADTPPTSLTPIIATYNSSVTFKASDSDTRSKRKRAQLHPTRLRTRTTARRVNTATARAANQRSAPQPRPRAKWYCDRARRARAATARTALELRPRAPRQSCDRARRARAATAREYCDRARRARAATARTALELRPRAPRQSCDRARRARAATAREVGQHSDSAQQREAQLPSTATARAALELRPRAPRQSCDRARRDLQQQPTKPGLVRKPVMSAGTPEDVQDCVRARHYAKCPAPSLACGTGRRRPKGNHIPPNGWTAATYAISMARHAHRRARTIPTKTQRRVLVQDYAHTSRGPCFT
ncbi:hypothetical protein EDB85DRAFT_1904589 [Lactarius pseudohatsudake]|nr:hypothetical protein EDB85DRAFT_1904589 [Lactarius pseudohatsudake]